jgi:uncharacterized membrane protein
MAEDQPLQDTLEQLIVRLEQLERVLQTHTERLYQIERRLGLDFQPPAVVDPRPPLYQSFTDEREEATLDPHPTAPPAETPAPFEIPGATQTRGSDGHAAPSAASGARGFGGPPRARTLPPPEAGEAGRRRAAGAQTAARGPARRDVESLVGGSWFNWIGIIAITFGVAFFLKYAFESQWIGPAGRVLMGGAAGLGILAAGEALRRRGLRQYAYVLSGGGILILYLTVYAAREFYRLIEQSPAFLLMTAVTAAAVLLAARYHALPIAVLGLIGGFLTPVLLSTGHDNQPALFTYIGLLDVGVLALAYLKSWRSLNYMAFISTVLMFFGWAIEHYAPQKLWLTIFFLTVFFLLFSALAVVHNVLARHAARWFDISLVSLNATFYFGMSYALLSDAGYARSLGPFALAIAGFFLLLFYLASSRYPG